MKRLASELVGRMADLTARRTAELALENIRLNIENVGKTIADVPLARGNGTSSSAVIIGAGPSLHIRDPVGQLLQSDYDGEIICADGALPYCLRSGLIPDYVVTVDPHRSRIVRLFGHPDLNESVLAKDDYFRRQDLDPYLGADEIARNQRIMELVNRDGPKIKAIIATCASPAVTRRCQDSGMELYWWNPLMDDFNEPDSLTRMVYDLNKVPCMATGGNSGSSAWVFANVVLRKKHVALVGMDFGYAPGTPMEKTQYYEVISELFGDEGADVYIDVRNPYLDEVWFTDPAYYWYRETFLQMIRDSDCTTYNCTEGGILFGEGVEFTTLRAFLDQWAERKRG